MQVLSHRVIQADEPSDEWIVFIHGAGGNSLSWGRQVTAFKPHYNLLLVDLRDHGKSKNLQPQFRSYNFEIIVQDLVKVLDHVGIRKAHFISLSMGSMILQKLALKVPDLVSSAIMAGGVFKVNWKIQLFAHTGIFLNNFLPYRWMYLIFSFIVMPRKNHRASRKVYIQQSKALTPKDYNKWLGLYKEFRKVLASYYHQPLNYPSLIVMGQEDHVFLSAAKKYAKKHKQTLLEIIPACGHICNIEKSGLFNDHSLKFLRQHSSRNPDAYSIAI